MTTFTVVTDTVVEADVEVVEVVVVEVVVVVVEGGPSHSQRAKNVSKQSSSSKTLSSSEIKERPKMELKINMSLY